MNSIGKQQIVDKLGQLIEKGEDIRKTKHNVQGQFGTTVCVDSAKYDAWTSSILTVLKCSGINTAEAAVILGLVDKGKRGPHYIDAIQEQLRGVITLIEEGFISVENTNSYDQAYLLENIFNKFHKIARQLRTRHNSRSTLEIEDEYDVQDLLHTLLLLHFDDVRPEEWTPSYAGRSVRMDFLLKDEGIVVEVKKTRKSMTAKSLGEELLIDREKYKIHPDCKKMYCFVYDPEGLLGNPNGIKKDLETGSEDFIKVFIRPE